METQEDRGLGLGRDMPPQRAVASLSVRVVGEQHPAMHIHPPVQPESQSTTTTTTSYPEAAQSAQSLMQQQQQRGRFAPAVSQSAQDDSDDDDEDDDSSEEDDEWGPGARKSAGGRKAAMAPQYLPTPQRSRRKSQPPQHIPPVVQPMLQQQQQHQQQQHQPQLQQQPPMQLRQPTPPPSPPLEMSFPLPDTPKQSPPDLNQAAAMPAAAGQMPPGPLPMGLQRQDSSSSSRSSSPEPLPKTGRGPLSLLVRKMESEFQENRASTMGQRQQGTPAMGGPMAGLGLVVPPGASSSEGERMVSPGAQPTPLLPHSTPLLSPSTLLLSPSTLLMPPMSEPASTITFGSGLPNRGVITTLVDSDKPDHMQGPSEQETKRDGEQKTRQEDVHAQQTATSSSTVSPQPLTGASITSPSSAAVPLLPMAKRRFFSDGPPPTSSVLSPTKADPARSDTLSAASPPAARVSVLFSGLQQQITTQPLATEAPASDAKLPKEVEKRHTSESSSAQPAALLPPSPPPDESKGQRKGREKEQSAKRPSSDSSSSDSDSSDSGSSDSAKKSPLAQKKVSEEKVSQ